jgi:UDP-N-acetylmuramoyl-tripeptide--D-alanyl-D-alanine ligase
MTRDQALSSTGGKLVRPGPAAFSGVSTDSRTLIAGQLFVALRGQRFDGHDFLREAAARGAAGVMVSRSVEDSPAGMCVIQVPDTLKALAAMAESRLRSLSPLVVAITGSTGKTTTKEMTAEILGQSMPVLRTPESYNNEVGVPLAALELDSHHRAAVFELAMRGPGEMDYLARLLRPKVGVITNVGLSHLERLGSQSAIAEAKAELLAEMDAQGTAVLNADDEWFDFLKKRSRTAVRSFGVSRPADVTAENIGGDPVAGLSFRLVAPEGGVHVELSLPGRHQVMNALAAAAAALVAGANLNHAAAGLARVKPGKHRLQLLQAPGGFKVLDDCYNASPASVREALSLLKEIPAQRHSAVLGDMLELGPESAIFHRQVGRFAAECGLDFLVAVGGFSGETAAGALQLMAVHQVAAAADLEEAASLVKPHLCEGSVVLVKGSRALGLERLVGRLLGE